MYSPTTARWMSRDPLGYEASPWNLYEYVGSNPVTAVDPSGNKPVGTGVLWCEGYQKGDWLFSWFSIHDFLIVNGQGIGTFRNKETGCTQCRRDDARTYPHANPDDVSPGNFYSDCDPIIINDTCFDPVKFKTALLQCYKNKENNPKTYIPGVEDCTTFVKTCLQFAYDSSKTGNCEIPPGGPPALI